MELSVNFKNVGDGDSIIIEWINNNEREVGIIDCKLYNGRNPVKEELMKSGYSKIKFMILSHPHADHYSGFEDLLNYCQKNKVIIEGFYHTALYNKTFVKNEFEFTNALTSSEKSTSSESKLIQLYRILDYLHNNEQSILKKAYVIHEGSQINLNPNLNLNILAPSIYDEVAKYFKQISKSDSPNANLLCSVIQISSSNWQVLLTSDASRYTFNRLLKENNQELFNKKLIFAQLPSHGSKNSFLEEFWNKLNYNNSSSVIISVSNKSGYNHPSKNVIDYFKSKNATVYLTDAVDSSKYLRDDDFLNLIELNEVNKNESQNMDGLRVQINKDGNYIVESISQI